MIDLYTWATPNGWKVSILLEAVHADYRVIPVNIHQQEQFEPAFLAISPNNKIPVIVDHNSADGQPLTLFETGAILIYIAEKYGQFIPTSMRKRYEMHEWLMWQVGGFGPLLGQAHHFNRFATEIVPYAISRYNLEAERLWGVLDRRLAQREYIVDELSLADFAIYPWAQRYTYQHIVPENFTHVWRWMQQLNALPAVQKGMTIPAS